MLTAREAVDQVARHAAATQPAGTLDDWCDPPCILPRLHRVPCYDGEREFDPRGRPHECHNWTDDGTCTTCGLCGEWA